jgi:ParB family transcriptional regulator, chromosome partitioning protein
VFVKTISSFFFNRIQTDPLSDAAGAANETLVVVEVETESIVPNPFQPRKTFSEEGLAELSSSIREFGVIQPLIVRQTASGYELIAGERRLRAAIMAQLERVPCVVRKVSDKEMAEMALIENLQREDLHYFDEASGYEKLLTQFNLTQDVLAARIGKDQSTIANKLRLLKLPSAVREVIYREKLTERHSRALLKIDGEHSQLAILQVVVEKRMNVRETDLFIENHLQEFSPKPPPKRQQKMLKIVKDVRIFYKHDWRTC